ncbi:hypothetical protein GCM10023263_48220 [Phytohabitans rumicis]
MIDEARRKARAAQRGWGSARTGLDGCGLRGAAPAAASMHRAADLRVDAYLPAPAQLRPGRLSPKSPPPRSWAMSPTSPYPASAAPRVTRE